MLNNTINKASMQDRLFANIKIMNDCWIWNGYICNGCACIYVNGKMTSVKRIAQQLFKKSVLKGNVVGSTCGHSLCMNPDHFKFKVQDCKMEGCVETHYAKGYCRNHYTYFKLKSLYRIKDRSSCGVLGCKKLVKFPDRQFCFHHHRQYRKCIKKGVPFDPAMGQSGYRNGMWRGGVSDYPRHYIMKKMRRLKIILTGGLCEKCGSEGKHVHHRDLSKDNHSINNLIFLCTKCHASLHCEERRKGREAQYETNFRTASK